MIARVLCEPGVSLADKEAAAVGLKTIGRLARGLGGLEPVVNDISLCLPELPSGQVDSALVEDLDSWAGGELLMVMTARDLGAVGLNFRYGRSKAGALVVSTARLQPYTTAVTGVTVHEAGHAFGLVDRQQPNYDQETIFDGHCANPCTMQPVNNLREMMGVAGKIADRPYTAGFCDDCADWLGAISLRAE